MSNENYYLFLLGTDTNYTRRPTKTLEDPLQKKYYERGETLSYTAQVVAKILGENPENPEKHNQSSVAFDTPSITVLNGPTTYGTEVGDRIAEGLYYLLQAVKKGKTTLEILSHSRGAVQAILIAHEFDRIKKGLKDKQDQNIYQLLMQSPCQYTRIGIEKFFRSIEEWPSNNLLLEQLLKTNLDLFLLDPVPGGSWFLLGSSFAWRDTRFYEKIPCRKAELIIFRDERTRCFIPIKPKELTPLIVPGHHGTASGNLYTQQFELVPASVKGYDQIHLVQDLALMKLLHFIDENTGVFHSENGKEEEHLSLEHHDLDLITNGFISKDRVMRKKQLFELYQKIIDNDRAFRYFSDTSYPVLGREETPSKSRFIHADGHNYTSLDTLTMCLHDKFINKEHAMLKLLSQFDFKIDSAELQSDNFKDQVNAIGQFIFKILPVPDETPHLSRNPLLNVSYNSSSSQSTVAIEEEQNFSLLIKQSEFKQVFFDVISVCLDDLSQKYLQNYLNEEQKTDLLKDVGAIFSELDEKFNRTQASLIEECIKILRKSFKDTIESHSQSLLYQSDEFDKRLGYYLTTNEQFDLVYNQFIEEIDNSKLHELALKFSKIKSMNELITQLKEIKDAKQSELLHRIIDNSKLKSYLHAEELEPETLLLELQTLYENMQHLIYGFDTVNQLSGGLSNKDHLLHLLHIHQDRITKLAAKLVIAKEVNFQNDASAFRVDVLKLVQKLASSVGRYNPEFNQLKIEYSELAKSCNLLKSQNQSLQQDLDKERKVHEELNSLSKAHSNKQKTLLNTQDGHITRQKDFIAQLDKELLISNQNILRMNGLLADKDQELGVMQEQLAAKDRILNQMQQQDQKTMKQKLLVQENASRLLIRRLNSPKENTCLEKIHSTLIPLTVEYKEHLWSEALAMNPELMYCDQNNSFSGSFCTDPSQQNQYQLLIDKYDITLQLLNHLKDTNKQPLPSERIKEFAKSLNESNEKLSTHRSPKWLLYVKNCLAGLLILGTGIVPGLLLLSLYTSYNNKSLFFFTKTQGHEFINEADDSLTNNLRG